MFRYGRIGQESLSSAHHPYHVIPYQAFQAPGFEQDLPRNEIKGTMCDHVFQCTNTLTFVIDPLVFVVPAHVNISITFQLTDQFVNYVCSCVLQFYGLLRMRIRLSRVTTGRSVSCPCEGMWFSVMDRNMPVCLKVYNLPKCEENHAINPYLSGEQRAIFSQWNLDHG